MPARILYPLLLTLIAAPAMAERIETQPRTAHVTVFPTGAAIDWQVDLDVAPGTHQLVLPGLPQGLDPSGLRLRAEGARIGAVSLQTDRALPDEAPESTAIAAARDRLAGAQEALIRFDADVAGRRAAADSWRERVAITRDLTRGDSRIEPGDLQATVDAAGGLIAEYMARAAEADGEADLLDNRRLELQRAVERAEAHLAAVTDETARHATLLVEVETTESPAQLTLSGFTDAAGWRPDYDLRLDRAGGRLELGRGLVVQQASGVDWQDVTLTLSTARPVDQIAPTVVNEWIPLLVDPAVRKLVSDVVSAGAALAEPVPEPIVVMASADTSGIAVVYDYPAPVTIRDGADALRLRLDEKALTPELLAEAAPRFDTTAFLMAETANTLDEPILPGTATLYLDGAMVGRTELKLTMPGEDLRLGFGPLDGMTAELRVPDASEGDRGIIRRSNQQTRTETLIVRNLTAETWPLRIVDRVPISHHHDLKITWKADPQPTDTDPDGRRGILFWQQDLPAGETREITLATEMRWPEGQTLMP